MEQSGRWRGAGLTILVIIVAVAVLRVSSGDDAVTADLVLRGGTIATADTSHPRAEAVAISGRTITAVGTEEEIRSLVGSETRVVDLAGRLAIPGFIEGHGHFMSLGQSLTILDLSEATSWEEIVESVRDAARDASPGEWILGRGWHQEKWDERPTPRVEGLPTHESLSEAAPRNPVLLGHASGHASFVNGRALEAAGITADTRDPEGGEIVRDAEGRPTGALRETAQGLVRRAEAESREDRSEAEVEAELRTRVELAAREALSHGVTTFHDAGSSFEIIDFLKRMADDGALPLRLYVMVRNESNEAMAERLPEYRMIGYGDDRLTVRSIKRQVDGALGSHGAWLLEPYTDLARSEGLVLEPLEEIRRTAEIAVEHGFQVNTHAIGDRANREILDLYEQVFEEHPQEQDLRWRIEHAQHLHPDDIPRFSELGVIASMQAQHACSDAPWVVERLGEERARSGAYPWRDLWEAGAVVTNGTDTPVESIDPLASLECTVVRELPGGEVFFAGQADQRLTREEALRSYTLNNAYAAFEEDVKGSIEPGKLADIVVLSRDIMEIPAREISEVRVDLTILGGEIVHRAE